MPRLKLDAQERFALAYALAGATESVAVKAYLEAGYEPKTHQSARQGAMRLVNDETFMSRVRELQEEIDAKVQENLPSTVDKAVKDRAGRITLLAQELAAINQIIADRAIDPDYQDIPGGKTGRVLLGYQQKGATKHTDEKGRVTLTPEYFKSHAYDAKLIETKKALVDQIRDELGQKIDRKGVVPMTVDEMKASPVFEAWLESLEAEAKKTGAIEAPASERIIDIAVAEADREPVGTEGEN